MNQMETKQFPDWERPWTTDDIRKNSQNWTLAGDSGLFNRLQLFSQNVVNKTDLVQENLDSLDRETKATNCRIHNVVNEFLMLSNVQFVENRVYDEEIVDENMTDDRKNESDSEKTKEQREAELVPRISCALDLGLRIIDDAFEKLEVVDSESENEDGPTYVQLPVLEPKDPYLFRPLPFIIGSEKFMQNENVGLLDEENESDKESLSESENSFNEETAKSLSQRQTESEQEPESKQRRPSFQSKENSESENESQVSDTEFFGSKSSGHYVDSEEEAVNYDSNEQKQISSQRNDPFASELAAKLSKPHSTDVQESENSDDRLRKLSKSKMMKQKQKTFVDNYEEDGLFSNSEGLFSGSISLFDSPPDEKEDLFSGLNNETISKSEKAHDGKLPSLKDTFQSSSSSEEKSSSASPAFPSIKPKRKSSSLFDNDDDDVDIFTDSAKTTSKLSKQNGTNDLFKDFLNDEESLFDSKIITKNEKETSSTETSSKKTLPAGAVSLFGSAVNPMMTALKSHSLHFENKIHGKESDSLVNRERSDSHSSKSSVSVKKRQEIAETDKKSDDSKNLILPTSELFRDEPNDADIFSRNQKKFAKTTSPPGTKSLFDDDSDDSDILFNPSGSSSKAGSKSIAQISDKASQKDLSLNGSSRYGEKSTSEPEGNLSKKNGMESKNKVFKGQVSLFDGEDYESDDIFSISSVKEDVPTSIMERNKSIFADDQLLNEPFEDSPNIDIFKTEEIKSLESTTESAKPLPKTSTFKGLSPGLDLFDDVDDDIFSAKVKLPGKPPIPSPRKTSLPKEDHKGTEALDATLMETSQKAETETLIKKPVGGVMLFQGIDVLGVNSKERKEIVADELKQPVENANMPSLTPSTISSPRQMPKNEEVAVSFDNPVVVNPLLNMGKSRAKVQLKRRLPSRKKIKDKTDFKSGENADAKEDEAKDLMNENEKINKTTIVTPSATQSFSADLTSPKVDSLTVNGTGIVTSPSTEEDDLFSLTDHVAPALISRIETTPRTYLTDIYHGESEDNGDENSIFLPEKSEVVKDYNKLRDKAEDKLKREKESDGGLFPSASHFISSSKDAKFLAENKDSTRNQSPKIKSTKSLFTDDDSDSDDLFADLSTRKGLKNKSTTKNSLITPSSKSKVQHSLFGDSDDNDDLDIFSDSLVTKK